MCRNFRTFPNFTNVDEKLKWFYESPFFFGLYPSSSVWKIDILFMENAWTWSKALLDVNIYKHIYTRVGGVERGAYKFCIRNESHKNLRNTSFESAKIHPLGE